MHLSPLSADARPKGFFSRLLGAKSRPILLSMLYPIQKYSAVVRRKDDGDDAFAISIECNGSDRRVEIDDAASFAAWVTLLSTNKAMYDPEEKQLVVSAEYSLT
jgi:hypothetical protein